MPPLEDSRQAAGFKPKCDRLCGLSSSISRCRDAQVIRGPGDRVVLEHLAEKGAGLHVPRPLPLVGLELFLAGRRDAQLADLARGERRGDLAPRRAERAGPFRWGPQLQRLAAPVHTTVGQENPRLLAMTSP
jgi:hypothetical protein